MPLSRDEFFDEDFAMDLGQLEGSGISPDDFNVDLGPLANQIDAVLKDRLGSEELTPQEVMELNALTQRAQRLAPIQLQGQPQSTAIPGNPYSYDVSPLIGGVQQGLQAVINGLRQRRSQRPSDRGMRMIEGAEQMREYAQQVENPTERARILQQADQIENSARATSVQGRLATLAQRQAESDAAREQRGDIFQEVFPDLAGR